VLVGRSEGGVWVAGRLVAAQPDEEVVREVEGVGVLEVVADHALVGRLHAAVGLPAVGFLAACGERHFHRIEFILESSPIVIIASRQSLYLINLHGRACSGGDQLAKRERNSGSMEVSKASTSWRPFLAWLARICPFFSLTRTCTANSS
jgi:hypothetical protein